jgi:pyrroloquinoline quinone biosynthesis protein E
VTAGELRPYTLVAELTYKCPLRCVYCSNPLELSRHQAELSTSEWKRLFREAEALGVVQLNLTGGEPLLRDDLEELVAEARALNLYTNLITSGVGLTRARLKALRELGLDSVQLSFQALDGELSKRIAGRDALAEKLEVAAFVRELGLPLTVNVVLHRENIAQVEPIIAFAEALAADRLELANAQYLGWALLNRDALLPTAEAIESARTVARAAKQRLLGKMEVLFVLPDYYAKYPRACMDGWGRRFIIVSPDGLVLPCQVAHTIEGLRFDRVEGRSLSELWQSSSGLQAFRGTHWMEEPCRSCERRELDFGGCRCQAYHLTGRAEATDPACSLSPEHGKIEQARSVARAEAPRGLEYRSFKRVLPLVP